MFIFCEEGEEVEEGQESGRLEEKREQQRRSSREEAMEVGDGIQSSPVYS